MTSDTLQVTIERYNPEVDRQAHRETYTVPREEGMVIADVLQSIYETHDPDLAFLWECRTRRCGTCAVRMGDKPVLTCQQPAYDGMLIRPLDGLPVVRDLIVERLSLEERIAPWLESADWEAKPSRILLNPGEIAHYRALSECIDCFICDSVCPALAQNPLGDAQFGGPRRLIRMEAKIQREGEPLPWLQYAADYNPSLCTRCFACTEACPRDLRPAEAIGSLTNRLYERGELDAHKTAHIKTFLRSLHRGGWLDEFRLLVDVYGLLGVLKFAFQALRLVVRGKLPTPHLRQEPQGKEIATLLKNMESGTLPRPTFTRAMDGESHTTLHDMEKQP